jgi:general secretion pathway protein G
MLNFFIKRKAGKNGFTLIELLVVISIIGVLLSIVLVSTSNTRKKARDAKRKSDIVQIKKALEMYHIDNKRYPLSGGAVSPNSGWSNSNNSASWNTFAAALKPYIVLPNDPINTSSGWAGTANTYTYNYYSRGYGCPQQWYMLVYRLEKPDMPSPGAKSCPYTGYPNGYSFNYSGTITTGMR